MKVLAFDPGFERLGVAVVEKHKDINRGKEVLLHSECVRTSKDDDFPTRLGQLGAATEAFIVAWQPDRIALENIYFENNAKSAMQVAQVRGVLAYIAAKNNIKLCDYSPLQVKVAVTGYGKSDKAAVAAMVARLVVLPVRKRLDDELDAIAIGLTCLASER